MQRVQLDGEWKTYMPEIASELPELLTAGGTAKVTQLSDIYATVEVTLKMPAKVRNWAQQEGDGIAINSGTNVCFIDAPAIYVLKLPKNGDQKIVLLIAMVIRDKEGTATLEDMRQALRRFAERMNNTWYYFF
jgi:hypothetical protein